MAEVPLELPTGRVVGKFIFEVQDNNDPGEEPQLVPVTGDIIIKSSIDNLSIFDQSLGKFITFRGPHKAIVNSLGELATPDPITGDAMYTGMSLWSNDSEKLSVKGWTYTATFNLKTADGKNLNLPPAIFTLATGQEVDLADVIKVPATPGYGLPQAEGAALRAEGAALRAEAAAQVALDVKAMADVGEFDGPKGDPGGWTTATPLGTADLDMIKTPGLYRVEAAANVTLARHYPVATTFGSLMVYEWGPTPGVNVVQEFKPSGGIFTGILVSYYRTNGGLGWSAWTTSPTMRVDTSVGTRIFISDGVTERMVSGNTGQRKALGAHLNGAADGDVGATRLARENNVVSLYLAITVTDWVSGGIAFKLPAGYRHPSTSSTYLPSSYGNASPGPAIAQPNGDIRLYVTGNGTFRYMWTWQTTDSWPTTLPGTPA